MAAEFNIPPGFRFHPTDTELLSYFLYNKLNASLSPFESSLIPYCDLYSNEHLSQIFHNFTPNPVYALDEFYCFTQLKKAKSRIQRSVGENGGSWHGEDAGVKIPVRVGSKSTDGLKKRFSYKEKGRKEKSGWIMTEYSLPEFNREFVLCRLKKTTPPSDQNPKTKKRKLEADEISIEKVQTLPSIKLSPLQRDPELEEKAQTLQTETAILSSKLTLLQRDSTELTNENNELKIHEEAMEQEALLEDDLTEAFAAEVQRINTAFTSQVNESNCYIWSNLDDICEL